MFHPFDNPEPNQRNPRSAWMALLSRAPLQMLEQGLADRAKAMPRWLRKPETGLYMVQARAGGTGERFNLGEITVTRCALRVGDEGGAVGVAYVMGRHHRHAQLAAVADALLQDPVLHEALEASLLQPVRKHLAREQAARAARARSTRVDFFTVAREAGTPDTGDEE
jgi:alpha-D-ribose 1-methylphosphonate 5-triphosphate synthase subunit PhnG